MFFPRFGDQEGSMDAPGRQIDRQIDRWLGSWDGISFFLFFIFFSLHISQKKNGKVGYEGRRQALELEGEEVGDLVVLLDLAYIWKKIHFVSQLPIFFVTHRSGVFFLAGWTTGCRKVFPKWAQYDKGGRERRVVISKLCILLASGISMLVCESFAERMMGTYLAHKVII